MKKTMIVFSSFVMIVLAIFLLSALIHGSLEIIDPSVIQASPVAEPTYGVTTGESICITHWVILGVAAMFGFLCFDEESKFKRKLDDYDYTKKGGHK